jgi:FkbM family methyltransferase
MIEMLNLKDLCTKYDINVKGVIQIGAHRGQEVAEFLSLSPEKILLIEAIPCLAELLMEQFKNSSQIKVANCAISDHNGTSEFHVTSNEESSSLLPLKMHSEIYPHIVVTRNIEVKCLKLDSLLEELNEDPSDYNFLYMDVQGAEYLAFQGATDSLKNIQAMNIEINYAELYENCVQEPELSEFLSINGFVKKEETRPFHPTWGDAFYVREGCKHCIGYKE